jgi:type IV pilus assembly protein PilM
VAIIDVGAQNMHINILHDNESVYLREHGFGGNQLNNEISRRYGMTSEEAESAKRKGTLPESYDIEVLQPYSETLAMEISRALQLFTTSTQYRKVDQILLAGGGAMIPGIDEVVGQRTGTRRGRQPVFQHGSQLQNPASGIIRRCAFPICRLRPRHAEV